MPHGMNPEDIRYHQKRCGLSAPDDRFYRCADKNDKPIPRQSYSREALLRGFECTPAQLIALETFIIKFLTEAGLHHREHRKNLYDTKWDLFPVYEAVIDSFEDFTNRTASNGVKIPGLWREHALQTMIVQLVKRLHDNPDIDITGTSDGEYSRWPNPSKNRNTTPKRLGRIRIMDCALEFEHSDTANGIYSDESEAEHDRDDKQAFLLLMELIDCDTSAFPSVETTRPKSSDISRYLGHLELDTLQRRLAGVCDYKPSADLIKYRTVNDSGEAQDQSVRNTRDLRLAIRLRYRPDEISSQRLEFKYVR